MPVECVRNVERCEETKKEKKKPVSFASCRIRSLLTFFDVLEFIRNLFVSTERISCPRFFVLFHLIMVRGVPTIRLVRYGCTNRPFFHIVVAKVRTSLSGIQI